jgi:hypothetical protein
MPDTPGSASTTIPLNGAPAAETPDPGASLAFSIPEAYRDKPYLKGVDSPEKVFAMLDGAQTLIGQRPAGIPAPDASPEEWNKFYDAAGRPKTAAEYTFDMDPSVKVEDKIVLKSKEIMHKWGLNPTQAKGVQKDFDLMAMEFAKEKGIQIQQENIDFEKLATKIFGTERETVLARGKELLNAFVPAELKGAVAKLSNENLIVLAGVLNGIHAKYIKTDIPGHQPAGAGGANTPDALRSEARTLMASKAYNDPMDPEHENVKKKVDELYRRAGGTQ